jgi:hypothetical protein
MPRDIKNKKDDRRGAGALFIPAGLFLGFSIGFMVNNIPAGIFGGLGAGFLAFAITALVIKKN